MYVRGNYRYVLERPRPGPRLPAVSLLVVLDTACGGKGSLLGSRIRPMAVKAKGWVGIIGFYNCDVSVIDRQKVRCFWIIPFCCFSRVCTMGPWKYRSRHGCVCHSDKHISLYQHVIYCWFHIVGEWFCIVEHFGSFLCVMWSFRRE